MTTKQSKGFTLLEILLVIAAIGILAAIVLVAINPNRQLAQARNAQRRADINTIYKALEQYLIDTGSYPSSVNNNFKEICNTGTEQVGGATDCTNKADLRVLVPTYLAAMPSDPSVGEYRVGINVNNNRIGIEATNSELNQTIAINLQSWTPAQISTELWLDAADISTVVLNGEKVSEWRDKSGNDRHATQAITAKQPILVESSVNGKSTITFDNVNNGQGLLTAYTQSENNNYMIYFAGGNFTSSSNRLINSATKNALISVTRSSETVYVGSFLVQGSPYGANNTTNIGGLVAPSSGSLKFFGNGTQIENRVVAGTSFGRIGFGSHGVVVGTGTEPGNGRLCEVIIVLQSTDEIRQQIEGYLAHKWGMTSNLPSDHPYKNTPPTAPFPDF
jgi:prepilin-type N-terminal cleavage/methylation domain-containing protein